MSEARKDRANWAEGLSVQPFTEGMEILYFPGCYLSYDPRLKKVARATAQLALSLRASLKGFPSSIRLALAVRTGLTALGKT